MTRAGLVVFISGNGSNLQAILDACKNGELKADVRAVISNKSEAYGLERARLAGIPSIVKAKNKEQTREAYDAQLADLAAAYQPDLIVLAGWMRVLSMAFLHRFSGKVINLHPALPGTFAGVNAIERAYLAFKNGEITHTGVMVHYVPDESVDLGPVIKQQIVPIFPQDFLQDLEYRVHACEHELLVESIKQLINSMEESYA